MDELVGIWWNMQEFGLVDWLLVGSFGGAILFLVGSTIYNFIQSKKAYVCKSCGTVGKAIRITPGSFILEIMLWFCLALPGLLYSIYRVTRRHNACSHCKSQEIIPKDSPIATKFIFENTSTPLTPKEDPKLSNWPPKAF